jgi:hypothetical protein
MDKNEHKKTVRAITLMAQGQALGGKILVVGEGMKPNKTEQAPYRILDGLPVFYSGNNVFEFVEPMFFTQETHKWGAYYHPYIMIGMPSFGGWNKLYVDTRIEGWYILWVVTKLDEWAVGPSDWEASILAWTPKMKKDSIDKAGYRMFWASALALDDVPLDEYCNDDYDEDGKWLDEWNCSTKCKQVFASIRRTIYENEGDYFELINDAPEILKLYIEQRKITEADVE